MKESEYIFAICSSDSERIVDAYYRHKPDPRIQTTS